MKQVVRLVMVVALLSPAPSFAYCAEPSEPWCLNSELDDFCRTQVKRYLNSLDEWAQCVAKEAAEEAAENAANKAEKIIKKWNCKAEGNSYCY
jgi:hypothetical protein